MNPFSPVADPPLIVLDTNVVLDWLVFGQPTLKPIVDAIESLSVRWLITAAVRDEMAHVLSRRPWRGHGVVDAHFWKSVDRWATTTEIGTMSGARGMVCRDPDDQKFIDLALGRQARWLVSRDKAVLALAKRAKPLGLRILTPERWTLDETSVGSD